MKGKGWIGIYYREFVKSNVKYQVIDSIIPHSPASKAGLKINDTIISVDGRPTSRDFSFKQAMDTVSRSRTMIFSIKNGSNAKNFFVNVYAPKLIPVLVKSIAFLNHAMFGYNIYINGNLEGNVRWAADQQLYVLPAYEIDNEIAMYVADGDGGILRTESGARGTISKFFPKEGFNTVIYYDDESNTINVKYEPLPTTQNLLDLEQLEKQELQYYNDINSSNYLAPLWFKKSFRKSLSGFVNKDFRDTIFRKLLQCTPVVRVLCLVLVLIIFYTIIEANRGSPGNTFFETVVIAIFLFLGAFLIAWLLNFIWYAFHGGNEKISYEFVCFLLLSGYVIFLLYNITISYFQVIVKSEKIVAKTVGSLALFISWVGFISTIFYILRVIGKIFGFTVPDYL